MNLPKAESSRLPDGNAAVSGIDTSYRAELIRKAIHFSSIAIPIFYFFTPRSVALGALIPLAAVGLCIDVARLYSPPVEEWCTHAFGWLLRKKETDKVHKRLNGATCVLISATVCVLVFPKIIAITSFIILIISDMMSALVGRRFGRHKLFDKSIEGSAAFFLSALLIVIFIPKIDYLFGEYIIGGVAAAGGAVIEALPWDIDDNLTIPLAVGSILWLGYIVFYPSLDIYKFG